MSDDRKEYLLYWIGATLDSAKGRSFAAFGHGDVIYSGGLYVLVQHPGDKHDIGTVHPHDVNGVGEKLRKVLFAGTRDEVFARMVSDAFAAEP